MVKQPNIPKDLTFEKVWFMFQESDKKFQETERFLKESAKESDRRSQETDRRFQETDKKIKELAYLFTSQWGKLIEALVQPSCLDLFKQRGLDIERSMENIKAKHKGDTMEIDVLLINDTELVVIEVKTTCRIKYIKKLKKDLAKFKTFFPEFKHYNVYGAIAALKYDEESDKHAQRKGLFVVKSSGKGIVEIMNPIDFKPMVH